MLAAALMLGAALAALPGDVRRYAVVVGDNVGDVGDTPLRYAEADATAFADTLREVGNVQPEDAVVLLGVTADEVTSELEKVRRKLAQAPSGSSQLIVYVSSHADEGDLHLAGTHLALQQLNEVMKVAPTSVAILIVDSCRSGAVTRLKGLTPLPGFSVNVELPEARGRVVLTSSGPNESAQESDSYRGSYFTHHLISALRGAADVTNDGLVTLQEAYAYAYRRTVETTFATEAGTQHPSYLVDLHGQGDLVLTDLTRGSGRLIVAVKAPGQWMIIRPSDGVIVGEVEKQRGTAVLAIAPGTYLARMRDQSGTRETTVTIPPDGEGVITEASLESTVTIASPLKGGGGELNVGLAGVLATAAADGLGAMAGGAALLRYDTSGDSIINDWEADTTFDRGRSSSAGFVEDEGSLEAGAGHCWGLGRVLARIAVEGGAVLIYQSGVPAPSTRLSTEPMLGARVESDLQLGGGISLLLSGFGGPTVLRGEDGWMVRSRWQGNLGLSLTL